MTFSRRQKILLCVATAHLVLVGMGAADREPPAGTIGRAMYSYGTMSGANSGYGFFAPGVGSQLRGRFDIYDPSGGKKTEGIESGVNREADLRVGNILGWFWRDEPNKQLQRSLAASWAGKIFARHPEAGKVGVRLDSYSLPTMEQYRAGVRPDWKPFYEAKFVRRRPTNG